MTIAMPRCSCGCDERLNQTDIENNIANSDDPSWRSRSCLTERTRQWKERKDKPIDNEDEAVTMGLVPARIPRACDACGRDEICRPAGVMDEVLMLCPRCLP